jgi:hypothetical protein
MRDNGQNEGKIPILLRFCTLQNLMGKMAAKMNHFACILPTFKFRILHPQQNGEFLSQQNIISMHCFALILLPSN